MNSDIGIQKGLSVPDSSLLVLLAEEFDTSVSTLLGETIHEESLNEGSLKNISEKLEVINLQLAKRNEMRVRTIRCLFITVCAIIVVVFIAFAGINSEYLTWNFNDPELAIVGTLLHGFEFLFVRLLISRLFEQKNKGISQIKLINIIKQLK